jgi:hypothetical protein
MCEKFNARPIVVQRARGGTISGHWVWGVVPHNRLREALGGMGYGVL